MPRRGENIRKRQDGRWEGRIAIGYTEHGRIRYKSLYGKTYQEVKKRLIEFRQTEMELNHNENSEERLFSIVLIEWLEIEKLKVKPSTYLKYERLIHNHISPHFGNVLLKDISNQKLVKYISWKSENGRLNGDGGLSTSTLQTLSYILKAALMYAMNEKYIPETTIVLRIPKKEVRKIQILKNEELKQLETYLINKQDISKLGILICLYMGLRLGEICALKWSDINLKEGYLHVQRTVQRLNIKGAKEKTKLVVGPTKSSTSNRIIPIPSFILEALSSYYIEGKGGYLLTGRENVPMEPRTYQYRFQSYLKELNISQVHFHVLRHTFATNCVQCGFDIKSLSEILGHRDTTITMNKYVHSSYDIQKRQLEMLHNHRGQNYGS